MRMYEVAEDGELKESPFRKESVESGKVYIFVNDEDKQIVLWNGKDARTRSKFIGARLASSLRLEHGLSYKLTQVDESETPDFVRQIDARPSVPRPSTAAPAVATPESPSQQVSRSAAQPRQPTMQTSSSASPSYTSPPRGPQMQTGPSRTEMDSSKIVERLSSIEPPKGFDRELIVIGHDMFAVSVSRTRVFGKEKVERKVGKVTNPLEDGIFLAEEYTPRVIIENGRVLAVEFLKGASQTQKKAERERLAQKEVSIEEPLESLMEKHLSEIADVFKVTQKKKGVEDGK
ncbi:MAG: hypothetical protein WED04_00685 [Promethearchaeati archaeon SRVP18_Atabeyarchaeia-1]